MKKITTLTLAYQTVFIILMAVSLNSHAENIETLINEKCIGCHEKNGGSKDPYTPIIAGISKTYFIEAMESYRKNQRPVKKLEGKTFTMNGIAKILSKEDISKLADYFSKQKYTATKQEFDTTLAQKGNKLHNKYCGKCHSENASSAEDDAGILAGQPKAFIRFSLESYANGKREMGDKMRKKFNKMKKKYGSEALEQLTHFYASQQ